jgi:2'-hydroxyisoflavone reductase
MPTDRREFVKRGAAALGALGVGLPRLRPGTRPRGAPLRVLILGGTNFLGPHQVRVLLERGHQVSIFTRGQREPVMFPALFERVEHLVGDRNGDLKALEGRTWDAVIDNSGQQVKWAQESAALLRSSGLYLFVSSTGVFYPYLTTDIREDGPVLLADHPPREQPTYGVMKALSERAVRDVFGDRAILVRPGYIVGPGDSSDRFPYWPQRIHRGGTVLVPGKPDDPVQLIDVRDLTEWMIRLIETKTGGTFNAVGPLAPLTMAEFVYGARAAVAAPVSWVWVDDYDFLEANRLRYAIPWILPRGDELGSLRINHDRAVAAGLTYRPLAVTVRDTIEWWYSDAVTEERRKNARFAIPPQREAEILEAWRARGASR